MLDIIKILVISDEKPMYEEIKEILEPLNFCKLDYETTISNMDRLYDFVIVDMDFINEHSEVSFFLKLKLTYNKAKIILIKTVKEKDLSIKQQEVHILSKPISANELLECLFNLLLEEVSNIKN